MNKETKKRIKAYKNALPHMKERVMAVAMLLVLSVTMMTSATFAWITLSRSPEISGLATTLAANGNLEIALSDTDGLEPDKTSINDGNGNITETNIKWGNVVNLSHSSYGLNYLSLRPASLNTSALLVSPMTAVKYGEDGRVENYVSDFKFSNFNEGPNVFDVPNATQYGVRAISSVTFSAAHAQNFYSTQLDEINKSLTNAKAAFSKIYGNSRYMNTISALVGIHVSVTLDGKDVSCLTHMAIMNKMAADLASCTDMAGQAIVDIANLHLYEELSVAGNAGAYKDMAYELSDLKEKNYNNDFTRKYGNTISAIGLYTSVARKIDQAVTGIEEAQQNPDGDVLWRRDLISVASLLCDTTTATLDGYTVSQLNANKTTAAGLFLSSDPHTAQLNDGALKELDQLLGNSMYVPGVPISVKMPADFPLVGGRNMTLVVDIVTNAAEPFQLPASYSDAILFAENAGASDKGTAVAADTYAMAIDFWVRTNEKNALLMLEGDIVYSTQTTRETGYDDEGLQVDLWEVTVKIDNEDVTLDVYTKDEGVTWYSADEHEVVDVGTAEPIPKTTTTKKPIGYEGVNRVWDELDDPGSDYSQMLGGTSISQGSGSCYIYYPESPTDQSQSKRLLDAITIAFVDQEGKLLGYAYMDTENSITDAGRVIVPIRMRPQKEGIVVGKNQDDSDIIEKDYIVPMVQNQAQRITAIIYLEGEGLSNSDVLAAGTINGQMNIQFGLNKMDLEPVKDEMIKEYYNIRFLHEKSFRWDSYDPNLCKVDLEVALEGLQPNTVRGQFVSFISNSQGVREQPFTMEYDEETRTWKATTGFSAPGKYRLRSLEIDGVDILLPEDQIIEVTIDGVAVTSLNCTGWGGSNIKSHMTAEASYTQEVVLTLGSQENHSIQGVFIGDNGKTVNVDMRPGNGNYVGNAVFTEGGTYEMTYLLIDGVYTPLITEQKDMSKTLDLRLNLQTTVVLGRPVNAGYYDLLEERDAAIAAATTEAEKENITEDYEVRIEEYLDVLYNGTGIEGDLNEKGLNFSLDSAGNLSFGTDLQEELYIDVRCIITDDRDEALTNLKNVNLYYGIPGAELHAELEENTNASYYEGRFVLTGSGAFSYREVEFQYQNREEPYTINRAVSAPTITVIPPFEAEYVEQDDYKPYTFDLGADGESRILYVKMKNAKAATLRVTITNTDEEVGAEGTTTRTIDVTQPITDPNTQISAFVVTLPSDGYWRISGLQAKNVFHESTLYTGLEQDPSTWWNLDAEVQQDNIATTFITEAYLVVSGDAPQPRYSGTFMTDHIASKTDNPMTVSLVAYDRKTPLEQVMRSVGIQTDITLGLTYTWQEPSDFAYSGNGTLPQNVFTVQSTDESGAITMEQMNFLLPGTYTPVWTISLSGDFETHYTHKVGDHMPVQLSNGNNDATLSAINNSLTVSWTAPDLTVTALDYTDQSFNVNIGTDGYNSYAGLAGVKNYKEDHYANMYVKSDEETGGLDGILGFNSITHTYPNMTLQLANCGKTGAEATVTLTNSDNRALNYTFNGDNGWSDTKQIGKNASSTGVPDRGVIGEQKITTVAIKYNNVTYTLSLEESVTVRQSKTPIYLVYEDPSNKAFVPEIYIVPDGRPRYVTLEGMDNWQEVEKTTQTLEETFGEPTTVGTGYYKVDGGCGDDTYYSYDILERTGTRGTETVTTTYFYGLNYWEIGSEKKPANSQIYLEKEGVTTATLVRKETAATDVQSVPDTTIVKQRMYTNEQKVTATAAGNTSAGKPSPFDAWFDVS